MKGSDMFLPTLNTFAANLHYDKIAEQGPSHLENNST